jgi:hypothetical protein
VSKSTHSCAVDCRDAGTRLDIVEKEDSPPFDPTEPTP